ncbi:hypothetical protein PM082_011045 [Marasmius tenuissimus]|nr:hypothetical protein PM082_011045 [Marasmius tenuissimus]
MTCDRHTFGTPLSRELSLDGRPSMTDVPRGRRQDRDQEVAVPKMMAEDLLSSMCWDADQSDFFTPISVLLSSSVNWHDSNSSPSSSPRSRHCHSR